MSDSLLRKSIAHGPLQLLVHSEFSELFYVEYYTVQRVSVRMQS